VTLITRVGAGGVAPLAGAVVAVAAGDGEQDEEDREQACDVGSLKTPLNAIALRARDGAPHILSMLTSTKM
jgi:hypothetical protein